VGLQSYRLPRHHNTRNVDPEIQDVVQRAIEATGYVPNRAARSLVTRRSGSIALIVSATHDHTFDDPFLGRVFNDPFFGRVVSGAIRVLRTNGIHLILMVAETRDSRTGLVHDLRQGQVDGAIVISMEADDPLPGMLLGAGRPVVLLGRPTGSAPISYVDIAHHTGTALAADRLVARGCSRIATIAGPANTPAGADRLASFRTAMARHGHPFIPAVAGNFSLGSGERAMEQLLADHPDIDGVFVANDLMAQGAVLVLGDHGRRVPDDVAVIGFDDSSAATASRPTLTTIRQPLEDMAATMAQLLLTRLDEPDRAPESVIFEPTLVIRQSA
jgi:DNA-binding LacI/PurR family transcriptional regulator